MRRLCRALSLFRGSRLTWRRCWALARSEPHYQVVARDGLLFIEPRIRA